MGLTPAPAGSGRSRQVGSLIILVAAILIVYGVSLMSMPIAIILSGVVLALLGLSLIVEVRQ